MLFDFVRNLRVFRLRDVRTGLNGFASTQLLDAVLQGSRSLQILDIELADDGNLKSRDPLRNLYSLMHCSRAIPNRVIVWDSLTDLHLAGDDLGDLLDALTHQVTSGAIQPHLEKLRIRQRDQYHKYDSLYRFLATFSGLSWLSIVCRVEDAQTAHGPAADAICCHAASLEVLQVVYLDFESPWAQQAFDMQGLNEICEASHVLHTLNMSFEVRDFDSYTASEASHILVSALMYLMGLIATLTRLSVSVRSI